MITLIIKSLALARLVNLIVNEEGPLEIFSRLRLLVRDTKLEELVNCPWCLGIWLAPIVYFLPHWICYILAIAELGCLIHCLRIKI